MNKCVPLWLFLLCLMLGSIFTVTFGWTVYKRVRADVSTGILGDAALYISVFPGVVEVVWDEVTSEEDIEHRVPRYDRTLAGFKPVRSRVGEEIPGLVLRADQDALPAGWRILVGVYVIDGKMRNAALALSPAMEIEKIWFLSEEALKEGNPQHPSRKFVHGFQLLKDGSIIFSFDGGVSLQRYDRCNSPIWAVMGRFHHSISMDDSGESVWALLGDGVANVDIETGEILQEITMHDLTAANPTMDILEIRTADENDLGGNSKNTTEKWQYDRFHLNDVDPLPAAIADRYDGFEAGDLLISSRSLNLVFVVDPDTLKIKWWRFGVVRRQHDPDWNTDGRIRVYDNRLGRDYSRIVEIDPASYRTSVVLDGREYDFYSRIRGKQQLTPAGTLLVTSPQQGRVFEVAPNGETVLEIVNKKPGSDEFNYVISEAIWYPADAFNFGEGEPCAN